MNTVTSIRNNRQPLTVEQIRQAAPSAFATEPYREMSSRYAYIPTSQVIEGMIQAGFQPFAASQSRTKIDDKRDHTKHMIRFRAPMTALVVGETFPEIVLVNSHDGTSAYKLMAGLFRLVCSNGMIVADSMIESVNVRHTGRVIEEVTTGSVELVEKMPAAIDAVARWKQIQLSAAEQTAFAEAAHAVRFADAEGTITTPIQPSQLLRSRRWDDNRPDLWSVFNRVQENVIKGGLTAWKPGSMQRTSTRMVKGIDQDVRLNRALWTLGERMAELRSVN
jgi:hypothetical protein